MYELLLRSRDLSRKSLSGAQRVELAGLKEPLKARVISKGDPHRYYVQKIVQKALHGAIRKMPRFRLTGTPLDADELVRLNPSSWRETLLAGREWDEPVGLLSGDYSDATNRIRSWASLAAGQGILDGWKRSAQRQGANVEDIEDWEEDILDGLCGNYVSRPADDGRPHKFEGAWQTEGQLMGAPVSFPVLCIVNSAVITCAYKRWMFSRGTIAYTGSGFRWALGALAGKSVSASQLPFLVNGDDCLMVCTEDFMQTWEELAGWAGLESSVGKSYFSTTWCIMNSAAYEVVLPDTSAPGCADRPFRRHPFLPFGSMFCASSRGAERRESAGNLGGDDLLNVVGPRVRWAVDHCPPEMRDRVIASMIDYYNLPARTPSGVSWWLPSVLGGLGLPCSPTATDDELYRLVGRPALLRAAFALDDERLAPAVEEAGWEQSLVPVSDAKLIVEFVLPRTEESPCDPFSGLCRPDPDYSPLLFGFQLEPERARQPLSPEMVQWMQWYDSDAACFVQTRRSLEEDVDAKSVEFISGKGIFDLLRSPLLNPLYSIKVHESQSTASWSLRYRGLSPLSCGRTAGSSDPPARGSPRVLSADPSAPVSLD